MRTPPGNPCAPAAQLSPAPFVSRGGGSVPLRRPNSVRRTTSIDIDWPGGDSSAMRFRGHSRDARTGADGALVTLAQSWVEAQASETREFSRVCSSEHPAGIAALAGSRAGGKLRALLRSAFPDPADQLSGHFLLLDDLAGASLVSSWGWLAWTREFEAFTARAKAKGIGGKDGNMRGVCIGLGPDSQSLDADGYPLIEQQGSTLVPDLANPADPDGWQGPPDQPGVTPPGPGTRRARWIDVWREDDTLHALGGFQDSALERDGGRLAIHEYRFEVQVDAPSGLIRKVRAIPHVLPHTECPAAVHGVTRLVGRPIADLRTDVPTLFAREAGCTHLNDVLRALVCLPALADSR